MISIEIDEEFYKNAQENNKFEFPERIPFKKFEVKIPFKALVTKKQMLEEMKAEGIDGIDPIMVLRQIDKNLNEKVSFEFSIGKLVNKISVYDINNDLWYKFSYLKDKDNPMNFMPRLDYIQEEKAGSSNMMIGFLLRNVVIEIIEYMNKPNEIKYKEKKIVKEKPKNKSNSKSNKNKVVRIKKTIYKIKGKKNSRSNYQRHTDSWHVRGHYRHYRNDEGEIVKKVWIPGYFKGNKEKSLNKKYKIKN
jgi:hypothetical protein